MNVVGHEAIREKRKPEAIVTPLETSQIFLTIFVAPEYSLALVASCDYVMNRPAALQS
jgi:hypothetical protein